MMKAWSYASAIPRMVIERLVISTSWSHFCTGPQATRPAEWAQMAQGQWLHLNKEPCRKDCQPGNGGTPTQQAAIMGRCRLGDHWEDLAIVAMSKDNQIYQAMAGRMARVRGEEERPLAKGCAEMKGSARAGGAGTCTISNWLMIIERRRCDLGSNSNSLNGGRQAAGRCDVRTRPAQRAKACRCAFSSEP